MKEEKNIVINVILSIVTCGIYGIIWFILLTDDTKEFSNDESMQSGGLAFVLTLITCGIYGYYWAYKMGKNLGTARVNNGLTANDNSILYIVLQLFGLGIVNYCLMQNDLNEIIRSKGSSTPNQPTTPTTPESGVQAQ